MRNTGINQEIEDTLARFFGVETPEKAKRPKVLEKPVPVYRHEWSKHPEQLRVSFEDGSTAVYELHTEQPAPVIVENIKIIRKWKQGYINQPEARRRRK